MEPGAWEQSRQRLPFSNVDGEPSSSNVFHIFCNPCRLYIWTSLLDICRKWFEKSTNQLSTWLKKRPPSQPRSICSYSSRWWSWKQHADHLPWATKEKQNMNGSKGHSILDKSAAIPIMHCEIQLKNETQHQWDQPVVWVCIGLALTSQCSSLIVPIPWMKTESDPTASDLALESGRETSE